MALRNALGTATLKSSFLTVNADCINLKYKKIPMESQYNSE